MLTRITMLPLLIEFSLGSRIYIFLWLDKMLIIQDLLCPTKHSYRIFSNRSRGFYLLFSKNVAFINRVLAANSAFCTIKDVREFSWMFHGVTCFWFLLNFLLFPLSFICYPRYQFPTFFQAAFQADKILLLRYSKNNYPIWLYNLNLMCEEISYQIINISAVNQAALWYYQKFPTIIIEKKTLALAVASNKKMQFFVFI